MDIDAFQTIDQFHFRYSRAKLLEGKILFQQGKYVNSKEAYLKSLEYLFYLVERKGIEMTGSTTTEIDDYYSLALQEKLPTVSWSRISPVAATTATTTTAAATATLLLCQHHPLSASIKIALANTLHKVGEYKAAQDLAQVSIHFFFLSSTLTIHIFLIFFLFSFSFFFFSNKGISLYHNEFL